MMATSIRAQSIKKNIMKFHKYLLLSLTLLLFSCDKKQEITKIDNPEFVAVAFFDALYNEKNLEKAASVCDPRFARIILHYKSTKAVARHVFNMSYDKVTIKPESSGVKIREQFKDSAAITLYFDGYYNGNRVKDIKKVSMIQVGGDWVMDKLLKDPF